VRTEPPSNPVLDTFAAAGFDWVATHAFRKTIATLMDHAGLSSRAAADQFGHANTSMTTDVYFGRKVAATGTAAVLTVTVRTMASPTKAHRILDRPVAVRPVRG
jgi:integrase